MNYGQWVILVLSWQGCCSHASLPSLPNVFCFIKMPMTFQPNNESSLPQRYEWTQHLDQYILHQLHVHCGYSSTMTSNLFPCWKTVWGIWALKSNKDLQLPNMQIENPAIKSPSAMRPSMPAYLFIKFCFQLNQNKRPISVRKVLQKLWMTAMLTLIFYTRVHVFKIEFLI